MRMQLLMSASALALAAVATPAVAQTVPYSGKVVTFTVASTGNYMIDAIGGSGGKEAHDDKHDDLGGFGANVKVEFALTQGEQLQIAVGQGGFYRPGAGGFGGGGGGGASFVLAPGNTPLIVAGGGGGGGSSQAGVSATTMAGKQRTKRGRRPRQWRQWWERLSQRSRRWRRGRWPQDEWNRRGWKN